MDVSPEGRISITGNNNNGGKGGKGGDGGTWIAVSCACVCLLSSLALAGAYYWDLWGFASWVDGLFGGGGGGTTPEQPPSQDPPTPNLPVSEDQVTSGPTGGSMEPMAMSSGRNRATRARAVGAKTAGAKTAGAKTPVIRPPARAIVAGNPPAKRVAVRPPAKRVQTGPSKPLLLPRKK